MTFINTNIAALRAMRNLQVNTSFAERTYEELATGSKIIRAADSPVEYAISEKLKHTNLSVKQAQTNASNGISILQTTEATLQTIQDHLHRIRELAVQSANDVNSVDSRLSIAKETRQLSEEINRLAAAAEFNGMKLLDGTATNQYVQIGPKSATAGNAVDISAGLLSADIDATGGGLGVIDSGGGLTLASLDEIYNAGANTTLLDDNATIRSFINDIDNSISTLLGRRGTLGALQNRLEGVVQNLGEYSENLTRSESSIRDVEVGEASSRLATSQLRLSSATQVLSRINQFEMNVVQQLLAG